MERAVHGLHASPRGGMARTAERWIQPNALFVFLFPNFYHFMRSMTVGSSTKNPDAPSRRQDQPTGRRSPSNHHNSQQSHKAAPAEFHPPRSLLLSSPEAIHPRNCTVSHAEVAADVTKHSVSTTALQSLTLVLPSPCPTGGGLLTQILAQMSALPRLDTAAATNDDDDEPSSRSDAVAFSASTTNSLAISWQGTFLDPG